MIKRLIFVVAYLFLIQSASASPIDYLLNQAVSSNLHSHKTWLKLVKYEEKIPGKTGLKSAIHTKDFFLSPHGKVNPEDELKATLLAFSEEPGKDSNNHPQCKFRARYIWLKSQLGFSDSTYPVIACPDYKNWAKDNNSQSVSLVFVTGYLGNPASYYGHTLLKFNSDVSIGDSNLLDVTMNYGAIIPDSENPISYILKGVFGGYPGGFSHIQYYYHNHNYGEMELRDLWEYQLNLTPEQVSLITAHAWELLGKKYTYFFIRKNCAYRMAELLELVVDISIIPKRRPWTIPQALIQNIYQAKVNGKPLVKEVTYRPSRQSRLYEKYVELTSTEKKAVSHAVNNIDYLSSSTFKRASVRSKQAILDTLIDYFQFMKGDEDKTRSPQNISYQRVLAMRLSLPRAVKPVKTSPASSPHKGRPPSLVRIGPLNSSSNGAGSKIVIRPAYYDTLDASEGQVKESVLTMLESQFVYFENELRLQKFDLINIESVNSAITGLEGDRGGAWKLKLGVEQQNLECINCLVMRIQGDLGATKRLSSSNLVGIYLGGAIQNNRNSNGVFYAKASMFANMTPFEDVRLKLTYEERLHFDSTLDQRNVFSFEGRYRISNRWEARFLYEKNEAEEISASIGYYW